VTLYFGPDVESVNGTLTQYYYAGNLLVAQKAGATKTWYHADRQGSIRLMTDSSGAMVASYDYQPFGAVQSQTGAVSNERGYTGHFMDGESGLIYMNARYEDPTLARFVSADDTIGDATNPQDLNAYSYVLNSPINNTDPTGHMNECECGADTGAVSPVDDGAAAVQVFDAPPPPPTPATSTPPERDPYSRAGGNQIPTEAGVATQAPDTGNQRPPDIAAAVNAVGDWLSKPHEAPWPIPYEWYQEEHVWWSGQLPWGDTITATDWEPPTYALGPVLTADNGGSLGPDFAAHGPGASLADYQESRDGYESKFAVTGYVGEVDASLGKDEGKVGVDVERAGAVTMASYSTNTPFGGTATGVATLRLGMAYGLTYSPAEHKLEYKAYIVGGSVSWNPEHDIPKAGPTGGA
jgi:RHS repeat-associated protein